ncbi:MULTISPECIES: C39 family peptidase [unclassified Pseudoalteromonas]|uniref:C39 family peptidase n=1 Tax=unclassified Pseudoalteromonas TaxID=194690 RepID=UPI00160008D7|nr:MULTISPECIES: C39 family peptidase [unclassified Pseudoalteromonas]MBB1294601.1 C39 family peptidase [Pseudoalteromonas sp. SR41-4]MBB1507468.1 C39 family peptidase [Pseudoalteromonas sp. SG41-1]
MQSDFLLCEFAKETLSNLVKERFGSEFPDINSKYQIKYLYRYLSDFNAQTILLEPDYVDRDFLEDYSRYYVKCFNQYGDRCARLHFFSKEINHPEFQSYLREYNEEEHEQLQKAYLGFIVVKPLPKTFIGKSCLRLYESFVGSDNKKALNHRYKVNLFGLNLHVDTVAFQEQDKVVSACATTSIWTALQALDKNDLRTVPSSSEITLSAINHVADSHNSFPNNGLTNKQILRSLDIQKLRNHKFNIDTSKAESDNFFNIVKSYLNSDLPIILGVDVYWEEEQAQLVSEGRGHAVTVLGYKERNGNNYLYIHDDRIGPFARVRIVNDPNQIASITNSKAESPIEWGLILEEKDDNGNWQDADQVLIPDSLIVPNYRKIRIPSEYISNTCNSLIDEYFFYYKEQKEDCPEVTHEIELVSSADYKSSLIQQPEVANKEAILCKPLAKYIWCAKFKSGSLHLFDILFDSTEIPQGDAVAGISIYDQDGFDVISRPLKNILEHQSLHEDYSGKDFLVPLIRSFKEEKDNYFAYLDKQFGKPRAPIRINREEISGGELHNQAGLSYYGKQEKCLADDFAELLNTSDEEFRIWVISIDGALLLGKEVERRGHPTLTGFKSARIGGELHYRDDKWVINSKSGRYSSGYDNGNELLANARNKFLEIYSRLNPENIEIDEYHPK